LCKTSSKLHKLEPSQNEAYISERSQRIPFNQAPKRTTLPSPFFNSMRNNGSTQQEKAFKP